MWLRNTSKKQLISVLTGVYIAAVLWITLFSRIETGYRAVYYPFQSYIEIFRGNWRGIVENIENIENIILFIPFGIVLVAPRKIELKKVIAYGLIFSLSIELLQLIFSLGTFEFDDLIHNTIGCVIGFKLVQKFEFEFEIMKLRMRVIAAALAVALLSPFGYQYIKHQHMMKLAEQYNREDGAENLLVLKGKDGYAWNTNVHVKYLPDGSIRIKGSSDKKSWFSIGNITLKPGTYVFSGLSDVEKNTVGLVLETDNHRIIEDVGPVEEIEFTLNVTTDLIAYVIVYPGYDYDVTAIPVIYKEE